MIEMNEEQRHAVEQGELVRACADGRDVLLLRTDVFRRIQGVLQVEKAVIQAGLAPHHYQVHLFQGKHLRHSLIDNLAPCGIGGHGGDFI